MSLLLQQINIYSSITFNFLVIRKIKSIREGGINHIPSLTYFRSKDEERWWCLKRMLIDMKVSAFIYYWEEKYISGWPEYFELFKFLIFFMEQKLIKSFTFYYIRIMPFLKELAGSEMHALVHIHIFTWKTCFDNVRNFEKSMKDY